MRTTRSTLATQATDANGKYLFAGLADGNYVVVVNAATLPANFGPTYDNYGSPDDVGQADISGGNQTCWLTSATSTARRSARTSPRSRATSGRTWMATASWTGRWRDADPRRPGDHRLRRVRHIRPDHYSSTIGGNYSLPNVPDGMYLHDHRESGHAAQHRLRPDRRPGQRLPCHGLQPPDHGHVSGRHPAAARTSATRSSSAASAARCAWAAATACAMPASPASPACR